MGFYGKIPPAFIPMNGKRLFETQVQSSIHAKRRFLSIPETYELTDQDQIALNRANLEIIRVEFDNICQSIYFVMEQVSKKIGKENYSVDLLYGDTVIEDIPNDSIAVVGEPEFYTWGVINESTLTKSRKIFAGRIKMQNAKYLSNSIKANQDIMSVINSLHSDNRVTMYEAKEWLDFGNPKTLIESRKTFLRGRFFNQLQYKENRVRKSSQENPNKINAEAKWYNDVGPSIREFLPRILESGDGFYEMEFIQAMNLSEVLVFGRYETEQWERVFKSLGTFFRISIRERCLELNCFSTERSGVQNSLAELIKEKTFNRLSHFPIELQGKNTQFGKIEMESIEDFVTNKIEISSQIPWSCVSHGDLVLSNIFWDAHQLKLTLIDPRATDSSGGFTHCGDLRYDLAKLYQSLFLFYEVVMHDELQAAKLLSFSEFEKHEFKKFENLLDLFRKHCLYPLGVEEKEIRNLAIALLIGLIPLHNDTPHRQQLFVEIIKVNLKQEGQ